MIKYLLGRLLRGIVSVILVVAVVMVLIYSSLDRNLIFANDPTFSHQKNNAQEIYKMQQWERYGYVDYISYSEYLASVYREGGITEKEYRTALQFGDTAEKDNPTAANYITAFYATYEGEGYHAVRLNALTRGRGGKYQEGGEPRIYVYKDIPLPIRLWRYLTGLIQVDSIHSVKEDIPQRGLTLTWYDPVYGGDVFSPAIMGSGTHHKYLLYCDNHFPYIHQNWITLRLGQSYSVNKGVDVAETMTERQGARVFTEQTYPSGKRAYTADDLHSAVYVSGSYEAGDALVQENFVDDYTAVTTRKAGLSRLGYSFVIGIASVLIAYSVAIPLGMHMARRKDGLTDKLGTAYIIFVMAVPTLGYIFLFKAIGGAFGLPTVFDMEQPTWQMYVLPVLSLALPAAANLMKWLRRYMIDQMHSDYVKFARAQGMSQGELFRKHILKNAVIPLVHGLPGSILGALVGAIITERVYVVPGAGNLLTKAINFYDNGVIVGVTLFYAVLSVLSVLLGDVLISLVDPRISFASHRR